MTQPTHLPPAPPQVVMIDQSTIYHLLLEVRDQGRATDSKVDALGSKVDDLAEDKKDHEARIRTLEQIKTVAPWQLWTAVTTGVALFGAVVALLKTLGAV